jgi:hypothetical protein
MRLAAAFAMLVLAAVACSREPKPEPVHVADAGGQGEFMPGHIVVKTKDGAPLAAPLAQRLSLAKQRDLSGGAILYQIEGLDPGAPDAKKRTTDAVDDVKKDPSVAWAEVDWIMTALPASR